MKIKKFHLVIFLRETVWIENGIHFNLPPWTQTFMRESVRGENVFTECRVVVGLYICTINLFNVTFIKVRHTLNSPAEFIITSRQIHLREGNVFTGVCLFTRVGGHPWSHALSIKLQVSCISCGRGFKPVGKFKCHSDARQAKYNCAVVFF